MSIDPAVGKAQAVNTFYEGKGDVVATAANILRMANQNYRPGKTLASGSLALMTKVGSAVHVVTRAETDIYSVEDFRGKKILGTVVAGKAADAVRKGILAAYGMTDDDIILLSGNSGKHLAQQLREGIGDAAIILIGKGSTSIVELCTMKDIRFIPLTKEKMETFVGKLNISAGEIPAGTYPGQDETVPAIRLPSSIAVRAEMDKELAYTLVKVLYEHFDEFVEMWPVGKEWAIEYTLKSWFQPFHPGAIKYYKEKGVWTKEMDAKQQEQWNKVVPAKQ